MAKLTWDNTGEHFYTTGVNSVALYVWDPTLNSNAGGWGNGVAWSGVTSIEESPDGGDANDFYADNIKYLAIRAIEEYDGSITAYQSPAEFDICDGLATLGTGVKIGQQVRRPFCLAWKTQLGNETEGIDYGYELHIMYNATASPSSRTYETINDSPEPAELSWDFETTPVPVDGAKPTSHVVINSKAVAAGKLALIEKALFGGTGTGEDPHILMPTAPSGTESIKSILDAQ